MDALFTVVVSLFPDLTGMHWHTEIITEADC